MNRRELLAGAAAAMAAGPALAATQRRFTVTVTGSGPDVILIPGLMSSAAVWDATVRQLTSRRRVHVIQVAGFAGSPTAGNAEGPVVTPLAEEIGAYIAGLGKPVAIIGHSMGGFIGLTLAAAKPALVDRVLVVDSLPFYPLLFNPNATVALAMPMAQMSRDSLVAMKPEVYAAQQPAQAAQMSRSEEGRRRVLADNLDSDRSVAARAMFDIMTTDARAQLPAITAAVTLLYPYDPRMGLPAPAVHALYAAPYAGVKRKTLKRIDGSFHFIMLDQPAAFATEVEAFVA